LGTGTSALATTVGGTGGTTQTSVTIKANPNATRSQAPTSEAGDEGDAEATAIPNGQKPTAKNQGPADQLAGAKKKSAPGAVVTMVKAGSADLIAGRLPQTSESRVFLMSVFGLLLLTVLMLSLIVYHQARLLKERE
jgi:LPXTG-motif cell wall-anchored protein